MIPLPEMPQELVMERFVAAKAFCDLLKRELDYDVRLEYGTLLGYAREGKAIEGDHDVDLCLMLKENTKQGAMQELTNLIMFLKEKSLLFKVFTKDKMIMACDISSPEDFTRPGGQMHVISPIPSKSYGPIMLDLFSSWVENGDYYLCRFGRTGKAEDVLPLKEAVFMGETFLVPKNPDPILTTLYGDWRTPSEDPCGPNSQRSWYLYL